MQAKALAFVWAFRRTFLSVSAFLSMVLMLCCAHAAGVRLREASTTHADERDASVRQTEIETSSN